MPGSSPSFHSNPDSVMYISIPLRLRPVAPAALVALSVALFLTFPAASKAATLPPISAAELQEKVKNSSGVPVVVEYWASWCGPCRRFRQKLEAVRTQYPEDKLKILAISLDEMPEQAAAYAEKSPFPYPVFQADEALLESREGTSIPRTELYGRDGTLVREITGDIHEKRLNRYIEQLME